MKSTIFFSLLYLAVNVQACTPGGCGPRHYCAPGTNGVCKFKLRGGESCFKDDWCKTNKCIQGKCASVALDSVSIYTECTPGSCATGKYCRQKICWEKKDFGTKCDANYECKSHNCRDRRCE